MFYAGQSWSLIWAAVIGSPTYNILLRILGVSFEGQALVLEGSIFEFPFITLSDKAVIDQPQILLVIMLSTKKSQLVLVRLEALFMKEHMQQMHLLHQRRADLGGPLLERTMTREILQILLILAIMVKNSKKIEIPLLTILP